MLSMALWSTPGKGTSLELKKILAIGKHKYPGAREELPPDMPSPKQKTVQKTTYGDADHAHHQLTRRSVTDILLFVNNDMPIKWSSKRKTTVLISRCMELNW